LFISIGHAHPFVAFVLNKGAITVSLSIKGLSDTEEFRSGLLFLFISGLFSILVLRGKPSGLTVLLVEVGLESLIADINSIFLHVASLGTIFFAILTGLGGEDAHSSFFFIIPSHESSLVVEGLDSSASHARWACLGEGALGFFNNINLDDLTDTHVLLLAQFAIAQLLGFGDEPFDFLPIAVCNACRASISFSLANTVIEGGAFITVFLGKFFDLLRGEIFLLFLRFTSLGLIKFPLEIFLTTWYLIGTFKVFLDLEAHSFSLGNCDKSNNKD